MKPNILAYNAPAKGWEDGLPIGNGVLAATVAGSVPEERITLNHEQFWRADQRHQPNSYITAGVLALHLDTGTLHGYHRELDMEQGLVTVTHDAGGQRLKREVLVHAQADIVALRVIAADNSTFSGHLLLERVAPEGAVVNNSAAEADPGAATLGLNCILPEGLALSIQALVIAPTGMLQPEDARLQLDRCNELIVLLSMQVSHDIQNAEQQAAEQVARLLVTYDGRRDLLWDKLRSDHVLTWRKLYNTSTLQLQSTADPLPLTKRLLEARKGAPLPSFMALLHNMGRYLLLAGNHRAALPATRQGKWQAEAQPALPCAWEQGEALPMSYWHAESCAISHTGEPLLLHIERVAEAARHNAHLALGGRGLLFSHITDAWGCPGDPQPQDDADTAAALLEPAWQRWLHHANRDELANRLYPLLREAAAHYEDTLPATVDPPGDPLAPLPSPPLPQRLLHAGNTLTRAALAAQELGIDADAADCWRHLWQRLPSLAAAMAAHTGAPTTGALACIWPGPDAHPTDDAELAWQSAAIPLAGAIEAQLQKSAKQPLAWAWLACAHARLGNGNRALGALHHLLRDSLSDALLIRDPQGLHLAVNSVISTAIAAMLVQSHGEVIRLLPALPAAWPQGSATGLRAHQGISVDLSWDDNYPMEAVLRSTVAVRCQLHIDRWDTPDISINGSTLKVDYTADGNLAFALPAGARCQLSWRY